MKPIAAIVGRPNVGKSLLFNRLAGARISIVEDSPGVTRDRLYADAEWLDYKFTLIDTGGIDADTDEYIPAKTREQAQIAIETADVIILVTDAKTGVTDADRQVADILRRAKKPVVLAVNKVDVMTGARLADIYEFYELGLGEPIPVSAGQMLGLGDLLDAVTGEFPKVGENGGDEDVCKVAVVGKPNVGKSSLINRILGEERLIVSEVAGTTRDAIDTPYERDGRKYVFIDTAGLRKHSRVKEALEKFSVIRSVAAVERCDVCVFIISAEEGVTEQDGKIAGIAHEAGKPTVIVVNKWDAVEKDERTMKKYTKDIETELKYMSYAPLLFISAKTGQRVGNLYGLIETVRNNHALRVQTGLLNDVLTDALATIEPPSDKGKQLKIYYITQVSVKPPTFAIFVNDVELFHFSYRRYIENKIREAFGFVGTPIHILARNRKE